MNFNNLYVKNYDEIFYQLYCLTNDVELSKDLRHDVYIKVIQLVDKKKFDNEKGFLKWLKRVTFNFYIDWYRKQSRSMEIKMHSGLLLFRESDDMNIEQEMIHQELVQQAVNGVEGLHDNWKQTYKLHVVDGLKHRIIAKQTGRSINTLLGEMRYSRKQLKKEIFK